MKKIFYLLVFSLFISLAAANSSNRKEQTPLKKEQKQKHAYPKDKSITDFESPKYPDGTRELLRFLAKTMNYPMSAAKKRMQGKAIVQFLVTTRGKVKEVKIKKSTGYPILDKEAVITIRKIKKMIPFKDSEGNPIDCYMELPVTFSLGR